MTRISRAEKEYKIKLYHELISLETDDCIIWPYGYDNDYPTMWIDGIRVRLCRDVLKIKTGFDPSDMVAAHSCRNRDCINYKHLSWKTHAQNLGEDKVRDGTVNHPNHFGIKNPKCKLSEERVHWIRHQLELGCSQAELARYCVTSEYAIWGIKHNVKWTRLLKQDPYIQVWRDLYDDEYSDYS